jgi:hypothetical protein
MLGACWEHAWGHVEACLGACLGRLLHVGGTCMFGAPAARRPDALINGRHAGRVWLCTWWVAGGGAGRGLTASKPGPRTGDRPTHVLCPPGRPGPWRLRYGWLVHGGFVCLFSLVCLVLFVCLFSLVCPPAAGGVCHCHPCSTALLLHCSILGHWGIHAIMWHKHRGNAAPTPASTTSTLAFSWADVNN